MWSWPGCRLAQKIAEPAFREMYFTPEACKATEYGKLNGCRRCSSLPGFAWVIRIWQRSWRIVTDHRRACLIDAFKEIDNYRNNLELKKHESLQEDIIDLHLILASIIRLSIDTIGPKAVWRILTGKKFDP